MSKTSTMLSAAYQTSYQVAYTETLLPGLSAKDRVKKEIRRRGRRRADPSRGMASSRGGREPQSLKKKDGTCDDISPVKRRVMASRTGVAEGWWLWQPLPCRPLITSSRHDPAASVFGVQVFCEFISLDRKSVV